MRGGIDKGFCLNYWKLSYRRKFLRDLWMPVVGILIFVGIANWLQWHDLEKVIIFLGVVAVLSARSNYTHWQAERRLLFQLTDGRSTGWKQVAVVMDGREVAVGPATFLIVNDGGYEVTVNGRMYQKGTSRTIGDSTPQQSDVLVSEGPNAGETILQIFQIEGDVLIACNAPPGAARPADFCSRPGSGHTLSVWTRVTPAAGA